MLQVVKWFAIVASCIQKQMMFCKLQSYLLWLRTANKTAAIMMRTPLVTALKIAQIGFCMYGFQYISLFCNQFSSGISILSFVFATFSQLEIPIYVKLNPVPVFNRRTYSSSVINFCNWWQIIFCLCLVPTWSNFQDPWKYSNSAKVL